MSAMLSLSCSIVIPTRDRAQPLWECLASIARQSRLPCEVILVDASNAPTTRELARGLDGSFACPLRYLPAAAKSLVTQRWQGIGAAAGDVILFLDDDVVLEPGFIAAVMRVFEEDARGEIGGVGGLTDTTYSPPSPLNALLLRLFVGPKR